MTGVNDLQHRRARAAAAAIDKRFGNARSQNDVQDYRNVLRNAPVYLRQSGLLQLIAFWAAKERDAERKVIEDLGKWLWQEEDGPDHLAAVRSSARYTGRAAEAIRNPIQWLTKLSSVELALVEAESDAYLGWLGRLTQGLYISLDDKGRKKERE